MTHHRIRPPRVDGVACAESRDLVRVAGQGALDDQEVRGQRRQFPGEEKRHRVGGERHQGHRDHEGVEGQTLGAWAGLVAHGVDRRGNGRATDEDEEEAGEGIERQLETTERNQRRHAERPGPPQEPGDACRAGRSAEEDGEDVSGCRGRPARISGEKLGVDVGGRLHHAVDGVALVYERLTASRHGTCGRWVA